MSVVVVGASLAGIRTAQALRSGGYDGRVVVLGEEDHEPYDRPPLSKGMLGGGPVTPLLGAGGAAALDIDLRLGTRAVSLDTVARCVTTADGSEHTYDQVVIATGSGARTGPWSLSNRVHVLRTINDSVRVREALASSSSLLVVGAGVVGLEVASAARARCVRTVVVEAADRVLARLVTPEVSEWLAGRYREAGVDLRLGVGVADLRDGDDTCTAELSDGEVVVADVVVVAIGASPHTSWLEGSGLPVGDGILCDATGRVEGSTDVYAVGDVARWFSPCTGGYHRGEHWTGTTEQASIVARNLLHPDDVREHCATPYMWSDQFGFKLQVVGTGSDAGTHHLVATDSPQRLGAVFVDGTGAATGAAFVAWPRGLAKARKAFEQHVTGQELAALLDSIE
jgi:phthalate 3,4-dioxygenase ferredoxin reductase subunit